MKNKKIIVTGGAGFIGSNLVKRLNSIGFKNIIIVDTISENKYKEKNLVNLEYENIIDKTTFINNLDDYSNSEFCFHQGACSDTTNNDFTYMKENNLEYSIKLLDFCNQNNIDMVYASSAAVYGDSLSFSESARNENPKNIYAKSKAEFDNYIRSIEDNLNINVTGLRYFNVYGPHEHHKNNMSSVILKFFNQMKSGSSIKIFKGSETYLRDFIFIEDVIDINIFFYKNRQTNIFNVGTSVPRSFREIAEIFKSIHKNLSIEEIEFPKELKGKYQKFTKADNSKINKVIPNLKYTPLEEGVKKYNKFLEKYSQ